MSAILGILPGDGRVPSESVARRMLHAMRGRGEDRVALHAEPGALLAVARNAWELDSAIGGDVLLADDGDVVVATDAALYYRDDLRAAIARRGVSPRGDTPAELVLAAYQAWGEDCAARLEGDFAFVVWNRKTRRACAARDFAGKRPLFHAVVGSDGTLVVASTVGGVLAHPSCPPELNLAVIAETAAGLFASCDQTAYAAITGVPAGFTLVSRDGEPPVLRRHWAPPVPRESAEPSFEEAAEALRELLVRAAAERMPPGAVSSVYMSGGYDSPAVFAAGSEALRTGARRGSLLPVSISYPHGDPGREDELIASIAAHWKSPVQWVDIADVPFFDRPAERAARRDEPFAHAYEMWHRALARGARAVGAHVAFEGGGGDQLFQVSEVLLADLLREGRWVELAREWRAKGMRGSGFRSFFRWAVQPNLSASALRAAAWLRGGRPLVGYLERTPPPWIDRDFARAHHLQERERAHTPQRGRITCAAHETLWYLTYPYFPRVFGWVSAIALEEGVELRSPLYDARVVAFALSRPRRERSLGRETKRLLRRAMQGLLPDEIVMPRTARTGITSGYFDRSMRAGFPALCDEMLRDSALVRAGIVDATEFRRCTEEYLGHGVAQWGAALTLTLQTELWLRAHLRLTDGLRDEGRNAHLVAAPG